MWQPSDLVTDLDLLALDRLCLTDFGVSALTDKRAAAALWAQQRVEQAGYHPWQHRTRKAPACVWGYTGAAYTDLTADALDATEGDVDLDAVFAAAGDALYVGLQSPFKGLAVGLTDTLNANTCVASVAVWTGRWLGVTSLVDGTIATAGKSFSAGGLLTWQTPDAMLRRSLNNSLLYYARVTLSTTLTNGTAAGYVHPVVQSRLMLPTAYYALGLLYQESYGSNRGQWEAKAERFMGEAKSQMEIALPLIADEFDAGDDDAVSPAEVSSIAPDATYLSTWERG